MITDMLKFKFFYLDKEITKFQKAYTLEFVYSKRRMQDFLDGGTNPKGGGYQPIILTNLSPKLLENENIEPAGGVCPGPHH